MRILNRNMEVGLNVLHLLNNSGSEIPSGASIAERLCESEFYIYRVLQRLRDLGYVTTSRGREGRYHIQPHVSDLTLSDFMASFDREWAPNPILTQESASQRFGSLLDTLLRSIRLKDLFASTTTIVPFGAA